MCGISGYINLDKNKNVSAETLVAMAAIQHHRGPDDYGWNIFNKHSVGFSHARLTIVNLSESGRQPFVTADESIMMAHNGEFYDYQKIRAELVSLGHVFKTKSDSEIALHLYQRYGLYKALKQLRGEFAFSLYDKNSDELILVRDRFGIKPLYYAKTDNSIVFGSEIKSIFAHPDVERSITSTGLYHQLMQTIVPGTTPYKNIFQVKPGHAVIIRRTGGKFEIREQKYWDMNFPKLQERENSLSDEESIHIIREKLIEAVHLRMEADVPVGCYLSGGIDSCSILGIASAASQNPVKAFTIGFDDDNYDESPIAIEMAQATAADHDILRLDANHLYDHFVKTHWHTERTIYNTLAVAKFLMSKHVHESKYRVVVTGEGSDELFGGYPSFRRDMFLHGMDSLSGTEKKEWEEMLQESNKLFKGAMLAEEEEHEEHLDKLCGFTPSCLQPWLAASRRVPDLIAKHRQKETEGYNPGKAIASQLDEKMITDRHPLDIAQYVWIKTMLEGQILTWGGDRVDMANSMEARPAFLDHHLAEAAVKLSPTMRIRGKKEKYVLREAMKGLLPDVLYNREKFAFMAPPAHVDQEKFNAMQKLADKYLSDQAIDEAGLLDREGVREIFRIHDDPDTPAATMVQLDAIINHMLGVQILHELFIATDIPQQAAEKAKELGWSSSKNCTGK